MVTAENGTVTFLGKSGAVYNLDVYVSDVVAAPLTWSPTSAAVAGSPISFRLPEAGWITDYAVATGNTVAVGIIFGRNGAVLNGTALRSANFLNTLAHRPYLKIPYNAGDFISATQF